MNGVNKLVLCHAEMKRVVDRGLCELLFNLPTGQTIEVSNVRQVGNEFEIVLSESEQTTRGPKK